MAGNNRGELEKVINHYKNQEDSLKLEAAYFLIKNMGNKYFYNSDTSKAYHTFFELTIPVWENEELDIKTRKDRFSFIYDSMQIDKITDFLKPLKYVDNIKASELIENIDLAFVAWKTYPWSKNVSFKDFCNYILPYNVFQEPLTSWRKTLMNRYRWVLDSIKDPGSLREAAILINTAFNKSMTYNSRMEKIPDILSFNLLDKIKMGKCDHLVTMNIYCLRAMGIPAKISASDKSVQSSRNEVFWKTDLTDFYSSIQLQGNLISSCPQANNLADRILDGDVLTYFVAEDKKGGWVGLDLGEGNLASISKVAFCPPNDGNSVEIGDRYNLLFGDRGWKSLGERIAGCDELIYENCPENALFLLKDITKEEEERIFTIENAKQVWW